MTHYRAALQIRPDYAEAHANLGNVLQSQEKLDEAVAHYQQALALKPDYPKAYNNLGNALRSQGRSDEAATAYRQALALKPNYSEGYNNLANLLRDLANVEEARVAAEKAVELSPANLAFHYGLAISKRFVPGDRQLEALEAIASDETSLSTDDRIYLHFALAKGYDDVGDYERSFARLLQANSLKRQQIVYDESIVYGLFARLQQVFTAALIRDKRGLGDPSSVPIFIIGMPRSGTTLIEQILASHPKVFGAGELMNLANAVVRLSRKAPFPGAISTMAGEELRELGAHYVAEIRQLAPEADRIIDKMPANFRLAGLIHLALPNARIIHVRRDPLDTCLSCFSKLFGNDQPFSYDLGELGRYYRGYEMLMEHWRRVLPPGVMLEVQYEQLVADLEGEGRRIVGHCGLEWDAACLSFHDTERQVRTASAVQVRQPIYRSSIGRWRAYEQHLAPLIEALGVDVAGGSRRAPSAGVEDRWATSAGGLPPLVTDKATVDERAYGRDVPALRRSLGETAGRLEEGDTPTS
jgi:tetratricopeptide (TPR) repeat protein